jgi:hypothetical protein
LDKSVQETASEFLEAHCVMDSLPENAKMVVLNHELTLDQVIKAMCVENNKPAAVVWNSEKHEFTRILTLRNIMELVTTICENLQSAVDEATHI